MPHFEHAQRLPITPLRLEQRLRRLRPEHADQLKGAWPLVGWRPERMTLQTDALLLTAYSQIMDSHVDPPLRDYIAFRMTQRILLAALRRKREGLGPPEGSNLWQVGPHAHHLRKHWETQHFGLEHVYPWLPQAGERLSAGGAIGLERLLLDLNWRWLTRCAEQSMFGFPAVMAFVFKWDMLQAWLASDANRAKCRFTELIDQVTHAEDAK